MPKVLRKTRRPPRAKNGTQLNAVVSDELFAELRAYCKREGRFRDKTVEKALRMFLRSEDSERDREFYVSLGEDVARRFRAFRLIHRYPAEARSGQIEAALERHISADITNPQTREEFEKELDRLYRTEPN